MKPRVLVTAILTFSAVVLVDQSTRYLARTADIKTGGDSRSVAPAQVSVFRDVADCTESGLGPSVCESLFMAASARAWQTSSTYVTQSLCEERYGRAGCVPTNRPIRAQENGDVFTPLIAGVATASALQGGKLRLSAFEPVYHCPLDRAAMSVCYQSVNGNIFKAYDKDRPVPPKRFDSIFRNAEREMIGDETDQTMGHHLINEQNQIVAPRTPLALFRSRSMIPPWPNYLERTDRLPIPAASPATSKSL